MKTLDKIRQHIVQKRKILLFFVCILLAMTPYLTMYIGFIDEMDNMLGGRIIADGGVLYRDYITQHTPLVYYLMALFTKLGITSLGARASVFNARILFYIIIVLFFMFVYFRYKRYFGSKALLILPITFVLDIARHVFMQGVLSDMFQAMALLVLFMEFFVFCIQKPKRLSPSSILIISLSIFIALGVAFMSIYAIFVIFFGVMILEVKDLSDHKQIKLSIQGKEIISRYAPLVISLIILCALYLGYFALNHALKDMVYQSYTFNRVIYPRYTGKYSSILLTAYEGINGYVNYFKDSFAKLYTLETLVPSLLLLSNIGASLLFAKKSKVLGITTIMFTIYTGIRGYADFHVTAYIMFSWFCFAYLMQHLILTKKSTKQYFVIAIFGILSFSPYVSSIKYVGDIRHIYDSPTQNYYINKYVPQGGSIFNSSLDLSMYFDNNVGMASRMCGIFPWYYDALKPSIIADLKKNKPCVIFYNPEDEVWGHKNKDYCLELEELLSEDYIYYPDSDAAFEYTDDFSNRVWIRKGIGVKSVKQHTVSDDTYKSSPNGLHIGEIVKDVVIKQSFVSNKDNLCGIQIMFATFFRKNTCSVRLRLYDKDDILLYEQKVDTEVLQDNDYFRFMFDDILDSSEKLYTLVIDSENAIPGNAVTIWCTNLDSYKGTLYINEKEQLNSLCIIPVYNTGDGT